MFEGQTVLITGGTGSWGHELVKQLLREYSSNIEIIIYSRGELAQVKMSREYPQCKYIIGDVRDYYALNMAMRNVDYVFHLAALKHVPVCEELPQEAVKTNIIGTTNVINAAIHNNIKKVIDVSTDKAVDPCNLYGMTKGVGEKLITQANQLSDTKFVCARGGNVIGSNGSVIPFFIDIAKNDKNTRLSVTDFQMTRYFLTLPEAIGLLFKACEKSFGGETFVMKMPSYRIKDIADIIIETYNKDLEIVETGIRPGEKIHEVLISRNEAINCYKYDDDYYVILPQIKIKGMIEFYDNLALEHFDLLEYASNTIILDKSEAKKMLIGSGFINE